MDIPATLALGKYGEQLACRYLSDTGVTILDRNWRCARGEIDIVARDADVLVVCEVKTRSGVQFGAPSVVLIPGTGDALIRSWDLTPDGQHIVRVVETDLVGTLSPPINVVLNWFEELNARLAAR